MTQVIDGTWVAYVTDLSTATDTDSDTIDFGTNCTTTLVVTEGFSDNGLSAFLENRGSDDNDDDCDDPDEGAATSTPFDVLQNELAAVPIGTSNQLIKRMESKTKMKVNEDFFYIYSPERIAIGQAIADIENNYPAIISGVGKKSLKIAKKIFGMISSKNPIVMTSTKAAEAEKLIEGLYRDVNIALVNQIAILCEKEGIDIWEIRNAANSQPFSNLHKA